MSGPRWEGVELGSFTHLSELGVIVRTSLPTGTREHSLWWWPASSAETHVAALGPLISGEACPVASWACPGMAEELTQQLSRGNLCWGWRGGFQISPN